MTELTPATAEAPAQRPRLLIWPLAIFAILALLFAFALRSGDPSKLPSALIGRPAPTVVLPPLEGLNDGLRPIGGKFTYLGGFKQRWIEFDKGQSIGWRAQRSGQPGLAGGGFARGLHHAGREVAGDDRRDRQQQAQQRRRQGDQQPAQHAGRRVADPVCHG